jgi:NAD(P)H-hydrate epimerase
VRCLRIFDQLIHPLTFYATAGQLREIDRLAVEAYGMHSLQLMENAGAGAASQIARYIIGRKAIVVCGKGNNAGDGFVVARHLQTFDFDVTVLLLHEVDSLSVDALHNYKTIAAAGMRIIPIGPDVDQHFSNLSPNDVVIDAMLGTGSKLPLRQPMRSLIEFANQRDVKRIALDIPTGLDADTGECDAGCFRADYTMTFAAYKQAFRHDHTKQYTGHIELISIGIPKSLLQRFSG